MLLDVIGTLVAFISVILLLSILVTATVQLIQAVLRLRARNLMKGLAQLIMKAKDIAAPSGIGWLRGDAATAKRDAAALLNDANIALVNKVKNPQNWLHYWVLGPKVSWVEPDEIIQPAQKIDGIDKTKAEQIGKDLERASEKLRDRFQLTIRAITFAVGLLIAFGFQVSTPELFSDLSEQPAIQKKIAADADELFAKLGSQFQADSSQENQASKSVDELGKEVASIVDDLSQYRLEVWGDKDFYFNPPSDDGSRGLNLPNLLGVFLTAILLSLGAPFWYEQLRNALRFRDLLSGTAGMGESQGAANRQDGTGKTSKTKTKKKKKKSKKKPQR